MKKIVILGITRTKITLIIRPTKESVKNLITFLLKKNSINRILMIYQNELTYVNYRIFSMN